MSVCRHELGVQPPPRQFQPWVLGDIAISTDVTVPWSICLSRSCILLKRQKLSTQFLFAEDSPMPLSDCIKIWLTSVNPILPQIFPKAIWTSETFDVKVRPNGYRYRNGHNGERIGNGHNGERIGNGHNGERIGNGHNGERIGNHHRPFEWYHHWPSTTTTSPEWGPKCTPRINFATCAATWRIW